MRERPGQQPRPTRRSQTNHTRPAAVLTLAKRHRPVVASGPGRVERARAARHASRCACLAHHAHMPLSTLSTHPVYARLASAQTLKVKPQRCRVNIPGRIAQPARRTCAVCLNYNSRPCTNQQHFSQGLSLGLKGIRGPSYLHAFPRGAVPWTAAMFHGGFPRVGPVFLSTSRRALGHWPCTS